MLAATVLRVPSEVLCMSFAMLTYDDRTTITHVCSTWRSTALGCPNLWVDITSSCRVPGVLLAKLSRTRGVPVHVQIIPKDYLIEDTARAVAQHLHHIRTLYILSSWSDERHSLAAARALTNSLCHPAPILLDFLIQFRVGGHMCTCTLPDGLFGRTAPQLQRVAVSDDILLPLDLSVFRTVTHLTYHPDEITADMLASFETAFRALTFLELSGLHVYSVPPRPSLLKLETLSSLHMAVLSHFNFRRVPHVITWNYRGWYDDFNAVSPAAAYLFMFEDLTVKLTDQTGRSFEVWEAELVRDGLTACYQLWDNLCSLHINESAWDQAAGFLFPRVIHLAVFVLTAQQWSPTYRTLSQSAFVTPDEFTVLSCPGLRSLTIARLGPLPVGDDNFYSGDDYSVRMALAPAAVLDLLEMCLDYDAAALDTILLHGVELQYDTAFHFGRLVCATRHLQITTELYPMPVSLKG